MSPRLPGFARPLSGSERRGQISNFEGRRLGEFVERNSRS